MAGTPNPTEWKDDTPRGLTYEQAGDWLEERYGGHWSWDDPEWWADMVEMLMEAPRG